MYGWNSGTKNQRGEPKNRKVFLSSMGHHILHDHTKPRDLEQPKIFIGRSSSKGPQSLCSGFILKKRPWDLNQHIHPQIRSSGRVLIIGKGCPLGKSKNIDLLNNHVPLCERSFNVRSNTHDPNAPLRPGWSGQPRLATARHRCLVPRCPPPSHAAARSWPHGGRAAGVGPARLPRSGGSQKSATRPWIDRIPCLRYRTAVLPKTKGTTNGLNI